MSDKMTWIVDDTEVADERARDIAEREQLLARQKLYEERIADPDDDDSDDDSADGSDDCGGSEPNVIERYGGKNTRVTLRMPEHNKQELVYWSQFKDLSMSEYVVRAVENQISRDNGHFDGETIMSARLAELADAMEGFETRLDNQTHIMNQMLRMFSGLITGDTQLLDIDDEDGDL